MPSLTPAAFRKAVQKGAFEPVYYLYGEDEYLKDEAVRRLVEAAVDPATRDFNLETRRGGEVDAETVGSLLGTPPMMADRRVTVLRDVAAMKKDARAALDRYLARPAADAVVVLVAAAGGKADKALCDRAAAVEYRTLPGGDVLKWITHHAAEAHAAAIAPAAATLLQGAVGDDLPSLAAELDKLASYANGREIDEEAVTAVVGVRRGETLGDFLDHVAMRDARAALALLEHVLQQPKTTAVSVVLALTTQTLALAWAKAMRAQGVPIGRLAGEFYGFLKEATAFTGRPWGEAIQGWLRALDAWTLPALDRALEALLAADCALKESRLSSDEQVLSTLVLTLCAADAPSRSRGAAA